MPVFSFSESAPVYKMLKIGLETLLPVLFFAMSAFFATPTLALPGGWNPVADSRATLISGNARFTILTPQLLRMEWAADGVFEDRASLAFINRKLPVPEFRVSRQNGWLVIKTRKLTLHYKESGGKFSPQNLFIDFQVNGVEKVWKPGMKNPGNLRGTTRTLDSVSGSIPLEPGLLSRDGWVLVDDSHRDLFTTSNPPWVTTRPKGNRLDWYFFGYGHNYKRTLNDFIKISGKIPMPPKFAFGTWWSRYWSYTDMELEGLVREFQTHTVPLDVLVVDMGWHLKGWTGYTFNPDFFPDPTHFMKWVHRQGLKITLNLHPAGGVTPYEKAYPEFARAMGIDPATKRPIPFNCTDPKYVDAYFKYLHHPLEDEGVDFWWLDWQQGRKSQIPGLDPLWWLNYLHFTDMKHRRKDRRPLIFSRWGGLGNHRFQIGFSGDTRVNWKSLAFQPYFTATAANVGYGYWSHDIGGHYGNVEPPELYTRWIQWGAFSPILRTHTTQKYDYERRIWAYPVDYYNVMREAFLLRYRLIPYIYTESRKTYDTGISILRPMYYENPESDEAYVFKNQYYFGDNMIVAPVVAPLDTLSQLAVKKVWLPEGDWYEWFTGRKLHGPTAVTHTFALNQIPVYVKAGSIIPMMKDALNTGSASSDLVLAIFPGANGHLRFYEDEGNTQNYEKNICAWTTLQNHVSGEIQEIRINPVEGSYPGMPEKRAITLKIIGIWPPEKIEWNGKTISFNIDGRIPGWYYDGNHLTAIVMLPKADVHKGQIVRVKLSHLNPESRLLQGFPNRLARLLQVKKMLRGRWPERLIRAVQTGNRIGLKPQTAPNELKTFEADFLRVVRDIQTTETDSSVMERCLAHLLGFYQKVSLELPTETSRRVSAKISVGMGDGDWLNLKKLGDFEGQLRIDTKEPWTTNSQGHFQLKPLNESPVQEKEIELHSNGDFQPGELVTSVRITLNGTSIVFAKHKPIFPAINTWWVLGPFSIKNPKDLKTGVLDEGNPEIDLKKSIKTRDGGVLSWQKIRPTRVSPKLLDDFSINFRKLWENGDRPSQAAYAVTFIHSDKERTGLLSLGSDDAVAIRLNGKLIFEHKVLRGYEKNKDLVPIQLKEGQNVLLAKITQAGGGWEFGARLLDAKKHILTGVRIGRE